MIIYHLPCKDHVKHYLQYCFGIKGKPVLLRNDSYIGKYFYLLIEDASQLRDYSIQGTYTDTLPIKITQDVVLRKGSVLTPTNIIAFNSFVSDHFKTQIRTVLDTLTEIKGIEIKQAIECVYEKFEMDESVMSYESIKKDYYRYKKRLKGLRTLE